MTDFFKKLEKLLSPQDRRRRNRVVLAMLAAALLEMAGIGVLVAGIGFFLGGQGASGIGTAMAMLALAAAAFIGKAFFSYGIVRMQADFAYRKQRDWCEALYGRYLDGDYAEISLRGGAECALNLSRIMRICDRMLLPALQFASDALLTVILGIAWIVCMPLTTLAGIVFFASTGGALYAVFRKKNRALGEAYAARELGAGKLAAETLDALAVVRAFSRENFFAERYRALQKDLERAAAELYAFGQAPRLILECCALLFLLALFGAMLALKIPRNTILLDFAAIGAVMSRLLPAFSRMHYSLTQIRQQEGLFDPFYCDVTQAPERAAEKIAGNAAAVFSGALEIRDLTFRYGESPALFENFSLRVAPGEIVGIAGPNGAGKSTLFSLILGLYRPEKGAILADGRDVSTCPDAFRKCVGFAPQKTVLFDDTVRGNLTLGAEISDEELLAALKHAKIDDLVSALPGGLDYRLSPDGENLSGGQRQKLAVARALCRKDVKLLLLDEPTSALDAMTEKDFAETLDSLRGKVTTLVISHREKTLRSCDRMISIG